MKKNGFTPILILLIVVVIGVIGFFSYKNYQIKQKDKNTPITVYTPRPTTVPEGYGGYNKTVKRFNLNFPPECISVDLHNVECATDKFKIVIDPEMPGRDGFRLKIEDITIGKNVWKKLVIKAGTGASISYELQTKDNYYLVGYEISADYFPFLQDSERYVEKILSTFKIINVLESPKPTCVPRPSCLDATPRCLVPETSDMCPPINTK